MNTLLKSAEQNWPEDEAYELAMHWQECAEDGAPCTPDEKARSIAHMEKVFCEHDDFADLCARFHVKLRLYAKMDEMLSSGGLSADGGPMYA